MDRTARFVVAVSPESGPAGLLRVVSSVDHCADGLAHVMLGVECPDGCRTYVSGEDVRPATPDEVLPLVLPAPAVGDLVMPTGVVLWADRPVPMVPHAVLAVEDYRAVTGDPAACALVIGSGSSTAYVSLPDVEPFVDRRRTPVIQFDHTLFGVAATCADCRASFGRCSQDEAQDWAADHEDICPAVIEAAHAEAMQVEVDAAHAEALAIRRRAFDTYSQVEAAYRHWSRLTHAEQAAWLRWAAGEVVECPVIDTDADDVAFAAIALWVRAPGGTKYDDVLAEVIARQADLVPAVTPVRTVAVELLDAVEVAESDGAAVQFGADQRVCAYTALVEDVDDAQVLLRELASALQWHTDAAEQAGAVSL
ncbi:MAG TPA: hypothetical protein VM677_31885 [Actinokineospora sp.]|nr:hypothetical protein [Actinokineospora sp.]